MVNTVEAVEGSSGPPSDIGSRPVDENAGPDESNVLSDLMDTIVCSTLSKIAEGHDDCEEALRKQSMI